MANCTTCDEIILSRNKGLTALQKAKNNAKAHSEQTGEKWYHIVKREVGYGFEPASKDHDFEVVEMHCFD